MLFLSELRQGYYYLFPERVLIFDGDDGLPRHSVWPASFCSTGSFSEIFVRDFVVGTFILINVYEGLYTMKGFFPICHPCGFTQ